MSDVAEDRPGDCVYIRCGPHKGERGTIVAMGVTWDGVAMAAVRLRGKRKAYAEVCREDFTNTSAPARIGHEIRRRQ